MKNEPIHLSNGNLESINESVEESDDLDNSSTQTMAGVMRNDLSISR